MTLARIAAGWAGGLLTFFGLLYLVSTQRMLGYAELADLPPTALTDLRVMYVALQVGPGAICLASVWRERWLEPALALATVSFACIAAVRILGMALDGTANQYHLTAVSIELPTCALSALAWRGLR